jgi:hypothetical protein
MTHVKIGLENAQNQYVFNPGVFLNPGEFRGFGIPGISYYPRIIPSCILVTNSTIASRDSHRIIIIVVTLAYVL